MENFEKLALIGTGSYGKVFLVKKLAGDDDSDALYAMKVICKKASQKRGKIHHIGRERRVLEKVKGHPFIVDLKYAFETSSYVHFVMDYLQGGDLFLHLERQKKFKAKQARLIIAEVVLGLEYLHHKKIIYRDLKLENILVGNDGHVCLADFGLCKEFNPEEAVYQAYSYCGTKEYMAPELIRMTAKGYSFTADFWSLGILTHEVHTGESPFYASEEISYELNRAILEDEPFINKNLGPLAKSFIKKLLVKDPFYRLGANGMDEIKSHRYFRSIRWNDVALKKYPPPISLEVESPLDTKYFPEENSKEGLDQAYEPLTQHEVPMFPSDFVYPKRTTTDYFLFENLKDPQLLFDMNINNVETTFIDTYQFLECYDL